VVLGLYRQLCRLTFLGIPHGCEAFSKGGGPEITVFGQNAIAIAEAKTLPYIAAGGIGLWSAFINGYCV
jgi:hypothetical protein